jgi:hypothetical protein
MRTFRVLPILALLALTSNAGAMPLLVDFTDASWSGAHGQTSYSQDYGSVQVSLSSSGGSLTSFAADAPASGAAYDFLALASDGIGIGDDEVSPGQALSVSFSSGVKVLGYYFLDLFGNEGPSGESAMANFGAAGTFTDFGTATDGVGFYARNGLNLSDVLDVTFTAYQGLFSDFALAGILIDDGTTVNAVAVPEPGTLGLLGISLLGFALVRRRVVR